MIEIRTGSGWRVQLRIVKERRGYSVKGAVYIRPSLLSPFFEIERFELESDAQQYARNVKDAIEMRGRP